MVQGDIAGFRVGETGLEYDSVTEDGGELEEAQGSGFGGHEGGPSHRNMYLHPYDSQEFRVRYRAGRGESPLIP